MNEKTFSRRFEKMEKYIYDEIFVKSDCIEDVLKKSLKKHTMFIVFSNIRFTIMHNCLIKAMEENLFKEDLKRINREIIKICIHLDRIIKIINKILVIKK